MRWLLDPANWQGVNGIPNRLLEHVTLSGLAVAVAGAVALPLGLVIGHTGRGATAVVSVANVGRALPSLALLLMLVPVAQALGAGLRFWPTFVAMVLLAIPPMLTNTYAGVSSVERDTVEAARGLGMRERQIALGIELPTALPVVLAGMRTAAVQVVATATLGALPGGGGLGRYIIDGFATQNEGRLVAGALLVALLAIATERLFDLLERRSVSPGLRRQRTVRLDEMRPRSAA